MTPPDFTVLFPVYNAEKYVGSAIESILNQTHRAFEFLIIDDGSTDKSLAVIEKYAQTDPRIKVISRPNKGFVATLNEGIAAASTDIIVRMDADDISLPTRFETQYAYMQSHPNCTIVGCQIRGMKADGTLLGIDPRPTADHNVKLFLAYGCALSGATVMFKKDAVIAAGGFLESGWPAEDYDCWVRMMSNDLTQEVHMVPDALYLYRENADGISLSNKITQIKKTIEVGRAFREMALKKEWRFLSYASHKAWFDDVSHIEGAEQQEQLRRIYYTIQVWFINDLAKISPLQAWAERFKLKLFTQLYNRENMPYIYNQPLAHSFPEEK